MSLASCAVPVASSQQAAIGRRPRLCVVGPMVGRRPGHVTHQGEIVADGLRAAGYPVLAVSSHLNRYRRLGEIVASLIAKRHEIDAVIIQVYGGPSFVVEDIASWLGQRFRKPIVMVLHGGAMPAFMARFPEWSRRVLRRAQALVTPSPFLANALSLYGLTARIIPNAIHLADYPYRHRSRVRPRLLWMRSFHETYNPMLAVRTLARVRHRWPDASLVMAGQDSGALGEVRAAVAALGLQNAIEFAGFLDTAGKRREGDRADIFLNTNRIDNMPVAIIEAAAMGLPIVATRVGGIPDLLTDGQTGLIVADDDPQEMASAVEQLVSDPDLAGRLSTAGRRLAERSAWTTVCSGWEATVADVLAS